MCFFKKNSDGRYKPSVGGCLMPSTGASVPICQYTRWNSTSSIPVRVISDATACRKSFSKFVEFLMARTFGLANISFNACVMWPKLISIFFFVLFSSAISVARRQMSNARRQSPETDATFLLFFFCWKFKFGLKKEHTWQRRLVNFT